MSWGINGVGKPAAVAAKIKLEAAYYTCAEPEEGVRQAAMAAVLAALAAQNEASVVQVQASGHQSAVSGEGGKTTGYQNTLMLKVEPILGFVE